MKAALKLQVVWLTLKDEAPRIGCGSRRVRILSIGHKFVKLEAVASGCRAKIRRGVWEKIIAARCNQQALEVSP